MPEGLVRDGELHDLDFFENSRLILLGTNHLSIPNFFKINYSALDFRIRQLLHLRQRHTFL